MLDNIVNKHPPKPLVLIDGSSYLYRAFYALPALTNNEGFPTGAIYGVINMLKKIISDYEPDFIAVVFDSPKPNFRHKLYPDYKSHRPTMPDDLATQIPVIHEIITALGVQIIVAEGVEADDVIATIAVSASQAGQTVLISTGDKDFAQIVRDGIQLTNTMTNELLDHQIITAKFGVPPQKFTDYLALIGDKTDNIPGVPSVGPKTAVKLLNQYGSLAEILAQAATIPGKVGAAILSSANQLTLSHQLVTIKYDVPLSIIWSDLVRKEVNYPALQSLAKKLDFKNLLNIVSKANETRTIPPQKSIFTYNLINYWDNFLSWDNTRGSDSKIVVQLVCQLGTSTLLGCGLLADKNAIYLTTGDLITKWYNWLIQQKSLKLWYNLKPQLSALLAQQHNLPENNFDVMLAAYVVDSSNNKYDLASLARKYLPQFHDSLLNLNNIDSMVTDQELANNTTQQLYVTEQLHSVLAQILQKDPGLNYIFHEIEMRLIPVLAHMESTGVLIDAQYLQQQTQELTLRLQDLANQAYLLAGEEFNLNSPQQTSSILFSKLNIPSLAKTPKGNTSTADYVLQELALSHPLPAVIIEYRTLSKLISTYTNKLPAQINPQTGRIHTSYNQTATITGRLSSSEPNLQNIPIKTLLGRRIRQAFIARPNYKIVSADYSQIELRLMAHISQDANLILAFSQGVDIHKSTAAETLHIPLAQVTPEQRRQAKAINFGILYGMSAFGLARQLKISQKSAQLYIDNYFARYPKVQNYMEQTRDMAHNLGYVTTIWGRRLYLSGINSRNIMQKKAAERAAINAPLQGSAADIIKMAMIKLKTVLAEYSVDMIMQVHDELVFEVKSNQVMEIIPLIRNIMSNIVNISVPLTVSIGYGDNWDEAHDNVIE